MIFFYEQYLYFLYNLLKIKNDIVCLRSYISSPGLLLLKISTAINRCNDSIPSVADSIFSLLPSFSSHLIIAVFPSHITWGALLRHQTSHIQWHTHTHDFYFTLLLWHSRSPVVFFLSSLRLPLSMLFSVAAIIP